MMVPVPVDNEMKSDSAMSMPEVPTEDNISIKRKRLRFRSWHRGTREMDLLLGRFADAKLEEFDDKLLDAYDAFLSCSDPDIYNWLTRQEPVPAEEQGELMDILLDFYKA